MTTTRRELLRRRRLRRTVTLSTVFAVTAVAVGGVAVGGIYAGQATAHHKTVLRAVRAEARLGDQLAASSNAVVSDGEKALVAAAGRTLDGSTTAAAEQHIQALMATADALRSAAKRARAEASRNAGGSIAFWELEALDDRLGTVTLAPERSAFLAARTAVDSDKPHLEDAVAAWQAEQDRLAAEKASSERAAAADAEKARAAAAEQAAVVAARQAALAKPAPAEKDPRVAPAPRSAPAAPAPASTADSKRAAAEAVFARYGFTEVTYGAGVAQGHYGATSLDDQHIYIDLDRIPAKWVASVAIHEYQHIKQARLYGGYDAVIDHYGSSLAMEQAADRMARADGATWTNYI